MKLVKIVNVAFLMLVLSLSVAYSDDDHGHDDHDQHEGHFEDHDAHVHGAGQLNLVLEGKTLNIEIELPSANIVGFEHKPSTPEQKQQIEQAIAVLEKSEQVFKFKGEAQCQNQKSHAEMKFGSDAHNEKHEKEHHEDGHDEHEEEGEHHEKEHHGDKHEEKGEVHSEFHISYQFQCEAPQNLESIQLNLFELFKGTENLNSQIIVDGKQNSIRLDHDHPEIPIYKKCGFSILGWCLW